ncbi:BA14K family protein [Pararhizobium arenae]|uniref:BA14K family protein n=1 Tax=Pararhizobium arenae TaxID=1856850 RepID=UPI00094B490A|nr:BA14K family protein [Pararhizobium arenae]
MSGIRSFVLGCALGVVSFIAPAMESQAMPLAVSGVGKVTATDPQLVDYRSRYGWNGTGYRPYRPYAYRPYRPYRPYAAPYAYRPYRPYSRPYYPAYRPYYRPGVQVYVEPRRYYQPSGNAHVEWCLSRYRSYNPQTDRFLTYGGVYKYCRSPYR